MGKIVIVDDEKLIATSISEFLCKRGFDALSFTDPREVIRRIENGEFEVSILMTDKKMPYMNGLELVREVKGFFPEVRAVLMSGTPVEPAEWQSVGCDYFFAKPVEYVFLATLVAALQ